MPAADAILAAARLAAGTADRLAADVARRRDVLIEERRRGAQHGRDVVESVARDVLGQHRLDVDFEPQHRVDLARVLGAVQTMECRHCPARDARRRRHRAGPPSSETKESMVWLIRLRLTGRWHQAAAQLAHRLFPGLRIRGDVIRGDGVEGDAAGPVLTVVALLAAVLQQRPVRGLLSTRRASQSRGRQHDAGQDQEHPCPVPTVLTQNWIPLASGPPAARPWCILPKYPKHAVDFCARGHFHLGVWDPVQGKNAPPRPRSGRRKAEKKLIMEV